MKRVLITGASSGIGRAVAIGYATLGWQVYAGGRSEERLTSLCACYPSIVPVIANVCVETEVAQVVDMLPALDLLILNAGSCEYIDDAKHFDGALFKRIIDTNLISVGYCLAHWLPKVKHGGQLALTSSSASFLALPRAQAYGASKAALSYLARTLSIDLAAADISVSLINPGFVETPLTNKNDFPMPGIVTTEHAAAMIIKGLKQRKHTINFPCIFIFVLSFLSLLPFSWWRAFAIRFLIRKTPA